MIRPISVIRETPTMTVAEAAIYTGESATSIRSAINDGKIASTRGASNRILVVRESIDAMLRRNMRVLA